MDYTYGMIHGFKLHEICNYFYFHPQKMFFVNEDEILRVTNWLHSTD